MAHAGSSEASIKNQRAPSCSVQNKPLLPRLQVGISCCRQLSRVAPFVAFGVPQQPLPAVKSMQYASSSGHPNRESKHPTQHPRQLSSNAPVDRSPPSRWAQSNKSRAFATSRAVQRTHTRGSGSDTALMPLCRQHRSALGSVSHRAARLCAAPFAYGASRPRIAEANSGSTRLLGGRDTAGV